jgi:hypothetical protein
LWLGVLQRSSVCCCSVLHHAQLETAIERSVTNYKLDTATSAKYRPLAVLLPVAGG